MWCCISPLVFLLQGPRDSMMSPAVGPDGPGLCNTHKHTSLQRRPPEWLSPRPQTRERLMITSKMKTLFHSNHCIWYRLHLCVMLLIKLNIYVILICRNIPLSHCLGPLIKMPQTKSSEKENIALDETQT